MASNNIARLGVVLGIDTASFAADVDKAISENKKLAAAIKRDSNAAAAEIASLKYATEDYGKTLTKVELIQREITSGRYMNSAASLKQQLLDQAAAYDKVAIAQKKVTTGMTEQQRMGLMYQTTDLFTQIASGGNPLIAFIQQGGQFKDQMGGFSNAFKVLTDLITPFRAAMALAAASIAAVGYAFYKGGQDSTKLRDDLILTGNLAGTTASKVDILAKSIGDDLSMGYTKARDVIGSLVEAGTFSERSFDSVSKTILQFSKLTGLSAKEAADKLIPSLDGSASSAKSLNDKYNFLTLAQYKQIEALDLQGKKQEAIILTSKLLGESLTSQERQLGTLEKMWKGLGDAVTYVKDALLSIGRPDTTSEALTKLGAQIVKIKQELQATDTFSIANRSQNKQLLAEKEAEFAALTQKLVSESEAAAKKGIDAEKNAAAIKDYKEFAGKYAQLSGELAKATADANYAYAVQGASETEKLRLEMLKKTGEAEAEMNAKNEQEKGHFAVQNKQIYMQKLLQIDAEYSDKLEQLRSKDKIALHKGMEEERLALLAINMEEDQRFAANDIAAKAQTKSLEEQKEMLVLKSQLVATTEKDARLAEITLKYDQKRKDARYKDGEESILQQLNQQEALEKFNVAIEDNTKKLKEMYDSVWSNMASAIDNFVKTGKLSFKDLARSIIQDLIAIQMKAQATGLFNMFVNSFFGGGGMGPSQSAPALDSSFNKYLSPKASGGPVSAGSPYMVGEKGPELFMPSGSGTIIPNNAMSSMGNTTNVTNNYINAIDTKSFEQRLLGSSSAIWAANKYGEKNLASSFGRT